MERIFVDTNIVLDLLEKRAPFYRDGTSHGRDYYSE